MDLKFMLGAGLHECQVEEKEFFTKLYESSPSEEDLAVLLSECKKSDPKGARIHEVWVPQYRLWKTFCNLREDFFDCAKMLFSEATSQPYDPHNHLGCRSMYLIVQTKFNYLCEQAGIERRPLVQAPYFARMVRPLLEARSYWATEFWGPRIMSPMQAKVLDMAEQQLFTGRRFGLKRLLRAWPTEKISGSDQVMGDPPPKLISSGKIIRNVEPGVGILADGGLSVKFLYKDREYSADIGELANAVGLTLPRGFSSKDPWLDKPLGEKRKSMWQDVLKAVGVLERMEDREFTLRESISGLFRVGSPLVNLPSGERLRVGKNAERSITGKVSSFSHIQPFIDPPVEGKRLVGRGLGMEEILFLGLQRYSSIAYDIRDRDGMVAAVRLFDLVGLVAPGVVRYQTGA